MKDEISTFNKMDPSVSGRALECIHRDKEGRCLCKEEVARLEKRRRRKTKGKQEETAEAYDSGNQIYGVNFSDQ